MDVAAPDAGRAWCARERPPLIVHFAAETHVTRSEGAAEAFFRTNVDGTRRVLDAAARRRSRSGSCTSPPTRCTGPARASRSGRTRSCPARALRPARTRARRRSPTTSPSAYADRLDVVVARPTNCIGPWQHPEKAVPRWATRALRGERLPVWGDGRQVRDWMYVADAVSGLRVLAERGERGRRRTTSGRPARACPTSRSRAWSRAAAGADGGRRLPERSTTGPSTTAATPSATARIAALGWTARAHARRGRRRDGRVVPRPRRLVGDARPRRGAAVCRLRSSRARSTASASGGRRCTATTAAASSRSSGRRRCPRRSPSRTTPGRRPACCAACTTTATRPTCGTSSPAAPRSALADLRRRGPAPVTHTFVLDGETPTGGLRPVAASPTATSRSTEIDLIYWVTREYDPADEHGVAWDDPTLAHRLAARRRPRS